MKALRLSLILVFFSVSATAQTFDVDTLQFNGPVDRLINIVILGDGYRQQELPNLYSDALEFQNDLFQERPFQEYRNYFNVFLINVPSNVSGAAMHPDSLIDNYFGSTYWYAGIERLLAPVYTGKVVTVLANNFPEYDQVIMLVNHTKYGGSGGWVSTSSQHISASEIAKHEMGHSFAKLKDEYWAGDQYAGERANMTQVSNPLLVKWKNWYGEQGIGVFQYCCGGNSAQWYRPHQNCKMQVLGSPFCAVCTEATVEQIHSLTGSPILAYAPVDTLFVPAAFPLKFEINPIQPAPNTLQTNWQLNGATIAENTDTMSISAAQLINGVNELSLFLQDTNQLLRVNQHENIHMYSVSWKIDYSVSGVKQISSSSHDFTLEIFPNPAGDFIQAQLQSTADGTFSAALFDPTGKMLQKTNPSKNREFRFDLRNFEPGAYSLVFFRNSSPLISRMIVKQ